MHSLLIQLLIAFIDREFSPEEYKQLLDEADKELGYAGMVPFYDIHNRISEERHAMHVKFSHPTTKFYHRNLVKKVISEEAARPPDETPVDWQPRNELPRLPINKSLRTKIV